MIAFEILQLARKRYLADTAERPLWTDETLLEHYNEARREAAIRALVFNDVADSITPIELVGDQAVYALDPRVIKVRSIGLVWPEGTITRLEPLTVTQMRDNFGGAWQSDTGQPVAYWPNQHMVRLYPIPNTEWNAKTLTVDGFRLPLVDLGLTDEETEFDATATNALLYWVCHLAYLFEDSDIANKVSRAELYAAKFAEKYGPPVKLSQRLHDLRSTSGFQSSGMAPPSFGRNTMAQRVRTI